MITDFFPQNHTLTPSQIELVNKLESFIYSDSHCFIISGAAGTGKTYILKGLVTYLKKREIDYHLCSPTGRAAKVLSEKLQDNAYTIHKTIYSQNSAIEYDNFLDYNKMPVIYFSLRSSDDDESTIYIVDEASMLSDKENDQEYLRFGSGRLLSDLIEYVNIGFKGNKRKIVFVGDKYQLPPVNLNHSPALNSKYLVENFKFKVYEHELIEIVRQKLHSGILKTAFDIRTSLVLNRFNNLKIQPSSDVIMESNFESFINKMYNDVVFKNDAVMITYTNERALHHNKAIKKQINDSEQLCIKDKIVVVNNCKIRGFSLLNGDFCTVEKLIGRIEKKSIHIHDRSEAGAKKEVNLYFQDAVIIKDSDKDNPIEIKLLLNVLYNTLKQLSADELRAQYILFKMTNNQITLKDPKFLTILNSDEYYNALQIKYGYAVTCHKAQGGEWDNVYVDFSSFSFSSISNQLYFQWLYTAITRAKNLLFCYNAPTIDFVDIKTVLSTDDNIIIQVSGREFELASVYYETEDFQEVIKYLLAINDFVLDNVKQIQSGFEIEVKEKMSETVYKYNLYYNKSDYITSIVQQSKKVDNENILICLKALLGFSTAALQEHIVNNNNHSFPNATTQSIYYRISKILSKNNIRIKEIKHEQWNEIYTLLQNNYVMLVNIYYNKKGFISSIRIEPNHVTEELLSSIKMFKEGE